MSRKWTDDDARWLKANHARMDVQSLSLTLGIPLAEVEKRMKQLKLVASETAAQRKAPASLKDQQREISAARRDYEKAIDLFHKRRFEEAAEKFEALLANHPDEKEFLDRSRMYLNACRNGKKARAGSPAEPEELYHAAVFEKNRGNVDKALELLKKTGGRKDGDGRVHYLAACCHALAGDAEQALANLRKAIAADDQNRIQARLEADLTSLRGTPGFSELVTGGLMSTTAFVVLAAGRGVRMRSERPKVLHEAAGRALLSHVLETARASGAARTVVVIGAGRELVAAHLAKSGYGGPSIATAVQDPPLGTGDAVKKALPELGDAERVVVLSGDVPLLKPATVATLLARFEAEPGCAVAFLTARLPDPASYGRVVRDGGGRVLRVVERKDASPEEREIREVNAGVYVFDRAFLEGALPRLTNANAQGEYYLTDVLSLAVSCHRPLVGVAVDDPSEVLGVNSRAELAAVDGALRARAARAAMDAGATLIRPETITLDATVVLEPDVVVEPFATLAGATRVGSGSRIGQGAILTDTTVGRNVTVKPYTVAEKAVVGDGSIVGPFARLREGTELAEEVHVGNFVETKKAKLARGAKANHLTYLGDVTVGAKTNVGAGVITCNYDGYAKHQTTIGADVFVGSDVQLVAPVTVGDGAMIGAGTTVTSDVPADALAVSRAPQKNLAEGARRYRERKKKKE